MKTNKTIDLLQVYRGIAAIMVVIYHIWIDLPVYFNKDYSNIRAFTNIGKNGVDFFFVLSGFIISYSYLQKTITLKDFFLNRVLRIYLPYLPISIFFILGYIFVPTLSNTHHEFNLLASLTLLPVGNPSLVVAWTLMHEMIFYFIFIIALYNIKKFDFFILVWSFCIIFFMTVKIKFENQPINYFLSTFFSPYNLEFVLGYFSFIIIDKYPKIKFSLFYAIFLLLLFVGLSAYNVKLKYFGLNYIFAFSCFWFIIYANNKKSRRIKKTNLFMRFGFASYSIYLIHIPIHVILIRIIPTMNVYFTFFIILSTALFGGIIYSYFFENKFLKTIKKSLNI